MSAPTRHARLNLRLSADLKRTIEQAATELGQTVSDFTVSTMAQTARKVLQDRAATALSQRDRDRFLKLIDDLDAQPNRALMAAARRYRSPRS